MAMSYEDALATLCSMFQDWDRETIIAIFESNGYHVERTIETILTMEQPESTGSGGSVAVPNRPLPNENLLDLDDVGFTSSRIEERQETTVNRTAGRAGNGKRGIPCTLPEDFLRLPGQQVDQQYLRDEQLAMLLQNELFQREVEQALGSGYLDNFYSENGPNLVRPRHRPTNVASSGSSSQPSSRDAPPPSDALPDMGILKALQGMGEGVRQQLNQLAVQFNNTATAALETIEGKRSRSNSVGGGSGIDGEMRPLTATDYEEEDEEESFVTAASSASYANQSNLTRRQPGKKDK